MNILKNLYWILVAATVLVGLIFTISVVPNLKARTSTGGRAFDERMMGYRHDEAVDYIYSLTPSGLEYYLGTFMSLDRFFLLMVALTLGISGWRLLPVRPLLLKVSMVLIAAGYAVFDYMENAAVYKMLTFGGGAENLPVSLVEAASRFTVLKFFFLDAALTVLVVLMLARLFTWIRSTEPT